MSFTTTAEASLDNDSAARELRKSSAKDVDAAGRAMRPVMSPDFPEPIARVPLPARWKFTTDHAPGEPSAVGPDGIRVYDTPFKAFSFPKEKSDAFWRQHRRKLKVQQRNFDAQQRAFRERSDATNDAIMKGWRDRNAASDRMHDKFYNPNRYPNISNRDWTELEQQR